MKYCCPSRWITVLLVCGAATLHGCSDRGPVSEESTRALVPAVAVQVEQADKKPQPLRPVPAEPLKYDATDVKIESLLPHARARAFDWNPDAVLTLVNIETQSDGKADLTRNPSSLMFSFFSPSAETSMLIVPTRLGKLALVPSPFVEGHHRIALPEQHADLPKVLKQARRDGFEGHAYRAVLYSMPERDGATSRCSWNIGYTGHRGSHSKPRTYDGATGKRL